MMFKNSIKLLVSNFSTVWKLLAYKLIVIAIVVGLFCVSLSYLNQLDTIENFSNSLISFLTTANVASVPTAIVNNFLILVVAGFDVIYELIIELPFVFSYIVLLFVFILPYLWHLSDIATSESLFGFMASQTKFGFTSSLIRNLNSANAYSWAYTILILPFNLAFLAGVIGLLFVSQLSTLLMFLSPLVILLLTLIYYSLRTTVLSCWASGITTTNSSTFKGFRRNLSAISRRFFRIWSTAIVFVFGFIVVSLLIGAFGLIFLLPIFCLTISVFGMVVFFETQGMRYYVDFDKIISPKKLEQTDKINKLKFII